MLDEEKAEEIYQDMMEVCKNDRMRPISEELKNLLKKIVSEKVRKSGKNRKWF